MAVKSLCRLDRGVGKDSTISLRFVGKNSGAALRFITGTINSSACVRVFRRPDCGGECVRRQLADRPRALAMVTDLFWLPQRHDHFVTPDTKRREMGPDGVGDVAWRKMRVVLFGHARVGVTELSGDDA